MLEQIVVVVLWLATANLLRRWVAHRADVAKQSVTLAIGALAAAFTVFTSPIREAFEKYDGVRNGEYLLGHCLALLASFAFQRLLIYLVHADDPAEAHVRSRRRLGIYLGCIALMSALFAVSPRLRWNLNILQPGNNGLLYWYMATFLSYGAWSLVDIVRRTHQYASVTPDRWTRRSMHWMSAGALTGCGYVVYKGVYLAQIASGRTLNGDFEIRVVNSITYSSAFMLTVACLMPPIGRRWSRWRRARRIEEDASALEPLWILLTSVHDGAILQTTQEVRKPAFVLARRKTEISDSLAGLSNRFDLAVAQAAQRRRWGLLWRPSPDTVDALVIAAAVRAAAAGSPPPASTTTLAGQHQGLPWMLAVAARLPRHSRETPAAKVAR